MNLFKLILDLIRSGTSAGHFYRNMNESLKRLNGEYVMLHYPMEGEKGQSFFQGQKNLTDFCISLLGDLKDKNFLEVGCGNGIQATYIYQTYHPAFLTGIDLDPNNISIATGQQEKENIRDMLFLVDDAQELRQIDAGSMDIVISIESAFHYADKSAFLHQIARVLKPGGVFLVADLLTTKRTRGIGIRKLWKGRMVLHHWNSEHYREEFKKGRLVLQKSVDITKSIMNGFNGYRHWISNPDSSGFARDFFFRIFYIINVQWVKFLLRNRRSYVVFVGTRT